MESVEIRGLEITYRRTGAGPPLVLLHGAVSDSRIWEPQLDSLADEFTVIAWDEPGAGGSSDLPNDYTLADYAHCLADLIDRVGLGRAHVAGLSWGGTVALELYRCHPALVASLVLADTYAGWKGSLPEAEVRDRVAGVEELLAGGREDVEDAFPGLFAGDPPDEFVQLLEEIQAGVRSATMAKQVSVMAEADLRDLLPRIEVPALLLWGELDARSPLEVLRQFEAAIPKTTTVVIPGAGHVTNLERPEDFNEAVRRFCLGRHHVGA
jgi:pimeloyl-ACP methyl ester carboxylesterase